MSPHRDTIEKVVGGMGGARAVLFASGVGILFIAVSMILYGVFVTPFRYWGVPRCGSSEFQGLVEKTQKSASATGVSVVLYCYDPNTK